MNQYKLIRNLLPLIVQTATVYKTKLINIVYEKQRVIILAQIWIYIYQFDIVSTRYSYALYMYVQVLVHVLSCV